MPVTKRFKRSVYLGLIRGLRRFGERVFDLSQQTARCYVPVDIGILRRSGYTKKLENGIEIGYMAPYAGAVEFGNPKTPFDGIQVIHTQGFQRAGYTRTDGTYVRPAIISPHDRTFINKRVVGFRPKFSKFDRGDLIFRVLEAEPERPGQFYLTRALQDSLPEASNDIEFELRKIKGVS